MFRRYARNPEGNTSHQTSVITKTGALTGVLGLAFYALTGRTGYYAAISLRLLSCLPLLYANGDHRGAIIPAVKVITGVGR